MKALVYDQTSQGWLDFRDPVAVLVAREMSEVISLLDQLEAHCLAGRFGLGYVSYEAASAFDPGLNCYPNGNIPLAVFGIFGEPQLLDALPACEASVGLGPVISETSFNQSITKIKKYLEEGDTYQVNYTHRLKGKVDVSARELFGRLISSQPSDYAACLEFEDFSICSLSPELFFETLGDQIRTEPMKGTRPRGRYPLEDRNMMESLAASVKDRAENVMIVDMIRNDLGRIAEAGSVKTDEMFVLRRLPTVWQQVSRVSATTDASLSEIFSALFPCASVTGAPRHRTMEIIRELEPSARDVYTGAIGMVRPGGDARFSVGIRTLQLDNGTGEAVYGVGCGIVWDSEPADEWQESLVKAEVLKRAVPEFSLLETLLFRAGSGIWLEDEHLARLAESADYFDYPFNEASVRKLLAEIRSPKDLRLRLLVDASGVVTLEQHDLGEMPAGFRLRLGETPVSSRDVFLFHKTTHRQVYESRKLDDCDDVILFNERGELTETTIANLVLEIDGRLVTPDLDSGLLTGTYRQHLLMTGEISETVLKVEDLTRASRLYIANSVRGLVPAVLID